MPYYQYVFLVVIVIILIIVLWRTANKTKNHCNSTIKLSRYTTNNTSLRVSKMGRPALSICVHGLERLNSQRSIMSIIDAL